MSDHNAVKNTFEFNTVKKKKKLEPKPKWQNFELRDNVSVFKRIGKKSERSCVESRMRWNEKKREFRRFKE